MQNHSSNHEEQARTDAKIFAFRRNIVVAASAGTGKTHRLTALYILLVLGLTSSGQGDEQSQAPAIGPERIVATTFSRAAADEISQRVERALRSLASWDGVSDLSFAFTHEIRARLNLLRTSLFPVDYAPENAPIPELSEIRKRATEALSKWPQARIDTLHGAARQLVQRYALDLGIPPTARILDEDEAQALSVLAVDETLTFALAEGGTRAETARALMISCGGVSIAHREIARLLERLDEEGITPQKLAIPPHTEQILMLRKDLWEVVSRCAEEGTGAFREAAQQLAAELKFSQADKPLRESAAAPLVTLFSLPIPRKGRTPADEAVDAFRKRFSAQKHQDRALKMLTYLREGPELAVREQRMIELLEDARRRLLAARKRAGALSFGDLLRAARDGLRDRPDLSRAARSSIDALLVDEFQDTSRVQRDLVYLLRERDDAAGLRKPGQSPRAEDLHRHGLFLVGDRKQSIYGFRGADVSVFARLCAELAGEAAGTALSLPPSLWSPDPIADFVALRESRRSGKNVLAFINAFSERDFVPTAPSDGGPPFDFDIAYGRAEHLIPVHQVPQDAPAPAGDVILIDDEGGVPEEADPLLKEATGSMREALVAAAYVACRIRRAEINRAAAPAEPAAPASPDAPPPPPVRRPPSGYKDIAILARRRRTIPLIELALTRLGIPYVVAGRALYDAPEIRDLAALLRLIIDAHDRLALSTVLRGPMVALSDTSLALLSVPGFGITVPPFDKSTPSLGSEHSDESSAILAMLPPSERERLDQFRSRFADLRRAAAHLSPAAALRAAITALDLDRILAALPRAEARIGNLDRLMAIAQRRGGTLPSFVRWLDRRIREEADEAEAAVFAADDDAVRLTTIHASKGLDFPVVILADLDAAPRPSYPGIGLLPSTADRVASLVVKHFAKKPILPGTPDPYEGELDPTDFSPWMPLSTPALRRANEEAQARELAERRRLSYVAITRARNTLVLIGTPSPPKTGTALSTLKTALGDPAFASTVTHREQAQALLGEALQSHALKASEPKPAVQMPTGGAYFIPGRSPSRTVHLAVSPLSIFKTCPRRFRLRYLLGYEEPIAQGQLDLFGGSLAPDLPDDDDDEPSLDRPPSPLHRVLSTFPLHRWGSPIRPDEMAQRLLQEGLIPEGEHGGLSAEQEHLARALSIFLSGPYALRTREVSSRLRREDAFVYSIQAPGAGRTPPRTLALRGCVDLWADYPGACLDIIEFSGQRVQADLPLFPLMVYALYLRRIAPDRPLRIGALYLGSELTEPVFWKGAGPQGSLSADELNAFEQDLGALGHKYAESQHLSRFEGVGIESCRKLRCGFIQACHGDKKAL